MGLMRAGDLDEYARTFATGSHSGASLPAYSVAVFAFCQPDSAPAKELQRRREYFDIRTGDDWDVFFPGYYQYGSMGDHSAIHLDDHWAFSPRAFDGFRRHLEDCTQRRWRYSGGSDLVILNTVVGQGGAVTVDYDSVLSGPMTDSRSGTSTLTLAQVIEAISADLEANDESACYGVGQVVGIERIARLAVAKQRSGAREAAIAAAGAILGEIGSRVLGLKP